MVTRPQNAVTNSLQENLTKPNIKEDNHQNATNRPHKNLTNRTLKTVGSTKKNLLTLHVSRRDVSASIARLLQ